MKKIRFTIIGMDCAACVISLDGMLEDTVGVKESRTDYAKSHTDISFDPDIISEEALIALINQTGYTVAHEA